MKIRQAFLTTLLSLQLALVSAFFVPSHALAINVDVSVSSPDLGVDYPAASGLSNADPRILIAKIIRAGIGLLGIVAVVIIIIAGFDWMTAGGNDEKVGIAKKWITAGVIGLIIILGAYSIASYVITNLTNAITSGDSGITN